MSANRSSTAAGDEVVDRRGLQDSIDSDQTDSVTHRRHVHRMGRRHGLRAWKTGMVWEQIDNKTFVSREMENPEVRDSTRIFLGLGVSRSKATTPGPRCVGSNDDASRRHHSIQKLLKASGAKRFAFDAQPQYPGARYQVDRCTQNNQ